MLSDINRALMQLGRRAELHDSEFLLKTFVDAGPLSAVLSSRDHIIIYGRRGTGKTHALAYSVEDTNARAPLGIFVDLRSIGSETSIYGDPSLPLPQRATRLLLDVLRSCHDKLVTYALAGHGDAALLPLLDQFAEQITTVRVEGTAEIHNEAVTSTKDSTEDKFGIGLSQHGVTGSAESKEGHERSSSVGKTSKYSGVTRAYVKYSGITQLLGKIVPALQVDRLRFVFDEWSTVPRDLQPYLADLLRRAILPCGKITVKIGAIEQRSNFVERLSGGEYLGVEVGADVSSAVNLDDFMVFGNDEEKARSFFAQLFVNHVNAQLLENGKGEQQFSSTGDFVSKSFTQEPAFTELVRASEGVPRDAINIASMAAQKADHGRISIHDVRYGARSWYQRDKETPIPGESKTLLYWIVDKVIRGRKARAFLLEQGEAARHPFVQQLFDCRVLHVVKRGISAKDEPGKRFDVYAIDYGCYVDLLTTSDAPRHLFEDEDGKSVDVPLDDYRSIRRAVLDLREFDETQAMVLS